MCLTDYTHALGGVGHCYSWHVQVSFFVGHVYSLSYFKFAEIDICTSHTNTTLMKSLEWRIGLQITHFKSCEFIWHFKCI